jgi:non-heme chloroperoxidase
MTKTRFMQGLCVGLSLLIGGTQMTAQDNVVTTGIPKIQFVTVEPGVNLEVLDWGGSGRALVLLAGLGRDAHAFKKFAPKLAEQYHVYGITRRGYGASDMPTVATDNYSADRLANDVLAVMDALKLERPILVGHSLAGEELSSIGSRFPKRVAGLVYLDAGYEYALYDTSRGDFEIDTNVFRRYLQALNAPRSAVDQSQTIDKILNDLPNYEKVLRSRQKVLTGMPPLTPEQLAALPEEMKKPSVIIGRAIVHGEQRYTEIQCPVLAFFAIPHDFGHSMKGDQLATAEAQDVESTEPQAKLFETIPEAKVMRVAHASHDIYGSNEAQVLQEMKAFIATLP